MTKTKVTVIVEHSWRILSSSSFFRLLFFLFCSVSPLSACVCFINRFLSVFCFSSLFPPYSCDPLPFIRCHAAYLPRIMIRPGDIVFQSDWGTGSPAPVGLFSISTRAWKNYPYLPGVVIFTKISFANWVLVGLGCRCFTISIPSMQAGFQCPRKRKRNSACLKRCVSKWKSIYDLKWYVDLDLLPRASFQITNRVWLI